MRDTRWLSIAVSEHKGVPRSNSHLIDKEPFTDSRHTILYNYKKDNPSKILYRQSFTATRQTILHSYSTRNPSQIFDTEELRNFFARNLRSTR